MALNQQFSKSKQPEIESISGCFEENSKKLRYKTYI